MKTEEFRLTPLAKDLDETDPNAQLAVGRLRVSELESFLEFLCESGIPFGDERVDASSEDLLNSLPLVLETGLEILSNQIKQVENGNVSEAPLISRTIRAMDERMETLFPRFVSDVRAMRRV